ncbi:MAG TPA: hypothetical protein GX742_03975 [Acholeplasmataceae bacterium]|nr:hypothetical protein [Acholeplasmataceae bacterium]
MKKLMSAFSVILTLFILIACDNNNKNDDSFEIINQDFSGNKYSYIINTKLDVSNDDLLEAGYSAASQIYSALSDEIGLNKRVLELTITVNNNDRLILTFNINQSVESPGLSLLNQKFIN